MMRCSLVLLVVVVVVVVQGRYAPTRDHTPDWLTLISGKQQFKDARILYSLLNDQDQIEKRDMVGFDSSEKVFEGFQHPFYYHQRQQQAEGREPVVFSRLGALASSGGARRNLLQALPLRRSLRNTPDSPQAPSIPRKEDGISEVA